MNIVEHNDNLSTKQASEVERYLLRIIQRYFDTQYIETQNSIEAIVVESLTRMKRDILHEKSFVFDVNGKAGHLNLNATSFGGEPIFKKNTAFNKDFTPDGQFIADTICMGNDSRLLDKRSPNSHNHDRYDNFIDKNGIPIVDINGVVLYKIPAGDNLNNLLEQARLVNGQSNHSHLNYSVLNKLRYSGSKTEIDLAKIAIVKTSLNGKLDEANGLCDNLPTQVDKALATLKDAEDQANIYLEYAVGLSKAPPAWYDSAIQYVDEAVARIERYCNDIIQSAVTQEKLTDFTENIAKRYVHIYSSANDIPIGRSPATIQDRQVYMNHIIPIAIPSDNTEKIIRVDGCFKYDIEVYEEDTGVSSHQTITIPLPYIVKESDGTYIIIRCVWNSDKAYIEAKTISKVPKSFTQEMQYKDESIVYVSNSLLTYEAAEKQCRRDNCRLCVIDTQDKMNFILPLLSSDKEYYINGTGITEEINTEPEWYWEISQNISHPMTFSIWDTNEPNLLYGVSHAFLNLNRKMQSFQTIIGDNLQKSYLYEYTYKGIDDYYANPRIFYQVYTGEGGD